jgi:hypothetical protein
MSSSEKKFSAFPAASQIAANDLILVCRDPLGVPTTNTITYTTFFNNVSVNVTFSANVNALNVTSNVVIANTLISGFKNTPTNSISLSVQAGTIFFDNNYVYVATSNNTVKRSALSSF